MLALALTLHLLSAVIWVGGMFAAFVCLRPAGMKLDAPQRLTMWRHFFARFLRFVWIAVILLLVTGYWMMITSFGGFKNAPLYINLMQTLGLVMAGLFFWMFHGPWLAFKRAADAQDWPLAATKLNRIRQIIQINLPLGLLVVAIASGGRFWGV